MLGLRRLALVKAQWSIWSQTDAATSALAYWPPPVACSCGGGNACLVGGSPEPWGMGMAVVAVAVAAIAFAMAGTGLMEMGRKGTRAPTYAKHRCHCVSASAGASV